MKIKFIKTRWMHLLVPIFVVFCLPLLAVCKNAKCTVKLDLDVCFSTEKSDVTPKKCDTSDVCLKQFNISYVKLEPYSSAIVGDLLQTCCGPCVKTLETSTVIKISEIQEPVNNSAHFVFPVLGRSSVSTLHGFHFIPLIKTPNIYYVTVREQNLMNKLLVSCVNMWPLMVICLLMVSISGFIGWMLETWENPDEFPRPFLIGWFEGFWWSFVSMTTVGYGDKVPKSKLARLFSIAWIFIGITIFSLVTAMLSSEIAKANTVPPPRMEGTRVGALRYRLYDAILISKNGGVLVDVKQGNTTDGIHQLILKLKEKVIDGFVLDRYLLLLFYRFFEDHWFHQDDVKFLKTMTVKTEITYGEDDYSYGVLVKNDDDYNFLSNFILDNRDVINTCNGLLLNQYSSTEQTNQEPNPLFSSSGEVFWPSFLVSMILLASICVFGFVYEIRRRKNAKKKKCALV